ncbi:MAG: ferritin family protein [Elusimicrobiales bacterium]|jgi:rubrerythrin
MEHPVFLYAAAFLTAAVIAYILFIRRGLEAEPVKGTALDRLEGTVRLRDVYRLAVTLEEHGAALYCGLAERAANPAVKTLCQRLAEEEAAHKAIFEKQLERWRPLPAHKLLFPALLEEARQKGILAVPPAGTATEEEMAAYAIAQEIKSVEFYQAFERAFPDAWKRAKMRMLVMEEKRHESDLRAAYPNARAS